MILFLSFSNIVGNVLTIVSGLLVAKWLLPEQLGLFNSFTVFASYVVLIQIGIPSGLARELPFHIGKGAMDDAKNYAAVAHF